jgi:DNA-directed RNA polymerase alpha subunit
MSSLYKISQVSQENVGFYFIRFRAESREEALCALNAAQHAIPATADLLTDTANYLALQPTTSAGAKRTDNAPTNPVCACDTPLPAAELSVKTYNALLRSRITTIGQFCTLELHDLMWLRNFGKKAVAEAIAYRARLGAPLAQ